LALGTDYSSITEPLLSSRSRAILTLLAVSETFPSTTPLLGSITVRCAPLEYSELLSKDAIEKCLNSLNSGQKVLIFVMNSLFDFQNTKNGNDLLVYLERLNINGRADIIQNLSILELQTPPKLTLSCLTRYKLLGKRIDDKVKLQEDISGWRTGKSLSDRFSPPPLSSPPLSPSLAPETNLKEKKYRIGIFGGSFNPITIGHLNLASQLSQVSFSSVSNPEQDQEPFLNEVWVVPCGPRPDKPSANKVSSSFRYALCVLGIEEYFCLTEAGISDLQIKNRNRIRAMPLEVDEKVALSSRDLFLRLKSTCSIQDENLEFHLIVGSDLISTLPLWRSSQELLQEVSFIFVPRSGYDVEIPQTSLLLKEQEETCERNTQKLPITYRIATSVRPTNVSSTQVRELLSNAQTVCLNPLDIEIRLRELVPNIVANVICSFKLYETL
jgi:nicotinate (nicotinamide) nucleotide adenylyltransferase